MVLESSGSGFPSDWVFGSEPQTLQSFFLQKASLVYAPIGLRHFSDTKPNICFLCSRRSIDMRCARMYYVWNM